MALQVTGLMSTGTQRRTTVVVGATVITGAAPAESARMASNAPSCSPAQVGNGSVTAWAPTASDEKTVRVPPMVRALRRAGVDATAEIAVMACCHAGVEAKAQFGRPTKACERTGERLQARKLVSGWHEPADE